MSRGTCQRSRNSLYCSKIRTPWSCNKTFQPQVDFLSFGYSFHLVVDTLHNLLAYCFYLCTIWCSCTGRLLKHTLGDSRPKSVLVNSLSVCISLLDPKKFTLGTYPIYGRQLTLGSMVPNPETVEGMLGSLGGQIRMVIKFWHVVALVCCCVDFLNAIFLLWGMWLGWEEVILGL